MFSSALKSFSSNIASNYVISATPTSVSGPWKIHDAKKKSTGKEVSVFIFDRKVLESNSGGLGRSSASSLKRAVEEVVERLKKEASSLARLRHPNILELVEPVEETRSGLQFATEAVTASLAGLLREKDEQERAGGVGGRPSRFVTEGADGSRKRRELEIDELEIQKGLLQISKALEFLHENAGLVHGNLTPDAVFVNAKSDWKISGLSFLSPPENSNKTTSITPISLSEVLNFDPRLPRSVQLNLDYSSPDFVIDSNLNTSADMFSLGLLIIALYNSPHVSPLETNSSITTYKRLFASSSTIPSSSNGFLSSRPLPKELTANVLLRLIARRPAQRMTAREFQQSPYFDNILVSTIRFLDSLPAKTPNEKAQFMRGLPKVIPSFPKSVLEKKVLPALLEEMKDRDLLSSILQNVFKIIQLLPSGKRSFTERILPRFREIFISTSTQKATAPAPERDPAKEAGLMVLLENIRIVAENCTGKEFKDEILPIIHLAIESPTHSIVDAALRSLPVVLPVLDFSTIKNDLFPVIATVFSKTSSLGIKVRGLDAFVILCGGSVDNSSNDGLDGIMPDTTKKNTSTALDKYTTQEKILPLIKGIKTKEPAVMLAALKVLRQVGSVADTEFIALDILPVLWSMSLGPLLDLRQFQSFMDLIKSLSTRVEQEHTKKLQELSGSSKPSSSNEDFLSFGGESGFPSANGNIEHAEDDFERLVQGKTNGNGTFPANPMDSDWKPEQNKSSVPAKNTATFAWSTPSPSIHISPSTSAFPAVNMQSQRAPVSRTITPDLSRFESLKPSSTQFSQPLQPMNATNLHSMSAMSQPQVHQPVQNPASWSTASNNIWSSSPSVTTPSQGVVANSMSNISLNQRPAMNTLSSFSLPPPPLSANNSFQIPQSQQPTMTPGNSGSFNGLPSFQSQPGGFNNQQLGQAPNTKTGLDKWDSLL